VDSLWVLLARIRGLVLRKRLDRDLEDELQAHLELLCIQYQQSGMNPDEAARAARLRLGGIEQTKETILDEHRIPWVANFLRDAIAVLRTWRRWPGMAVVTVLTLAIGVGANIALADLVHALMFRPPEGVKAADQVVSVTHADNYVRYSDIRDQSHSLEAAGILSGMIPALQASRIDAASLASSSKSTHDRNGFRKANGACLPLCDDCAWFAQMKLPGTGSSCSGILTL